MDSGKTDGPWLEPGREAGLVLSAQKGERPAFLELIREYQRPLFRLCFAFARDPSGAAHLAHEASLHAWRGLRHLPVGRPFFPWLARIARNLAVTRERRRAGDQPGRLPLTRPSGEAWNTPGTDAADIARDQRALVAFAQLPPDEQMILALRLSERLDYAALGSVFECQLGAAMHRLSVVRERLDDAIGEDPSEAAA